MYKFFNMFLSPYMGFSKTTWKVITAGFINSTGLTLALYLSLYFNSLGYTVTQIGFIISLFGIGGLFGGYFGGYLTDKFSALKVCKFSLLINSLFLLLLPISHNYYFLSSISILLGIANNLFRPAFILVLASGEKTGELEKIIALRRVAINLGMAFGAAIFGLIVPLGYIFLFWVNAFASLLAFMIITGIEDTPHVATSNKVINYSKQNRTLYLVLFLMFAILLVFCQNQVVYPLFLKNDIHLNVHLLSLLFALNGILIAFFQMPIASKFSKINTNITCSIGTLFIGLGFAILPLCYINILYSIVSCILWSLGEIIFFPAILVLILKLSGNKKGKNIGLYQFVFSFAQLAAPTIGTIIYSFDKSMIWYLSGLIGISVSLSFLLSIRFFNSIIFESSPKTLMSNKI